MFLYTKSTEYINLLSSTRCRQELKELRAMNNDAQIARDAAKQELERQERQVYEERRRRELELAQVRKKAEEKRLQHERIERRIVRFIQKHMCTLSIF